MFGIIWNCLSRQADQWVGEWNESSAVRRRWHYPAIDRFLRHKGERPIAFLFDIVVSATFITLIGWVFVRFHLPDYGRELVFNRGNELVYFSALWTIQTTLAALVYPIVFSFVAVLLRRRATATLGLRIYSLDAGVVPAGTSSIALVGWMGLQYLALPFTSSEWIAAAIIGDAGWFIANTLLTTRFLFRTIHFLNDDERLAVFQGFAVHVALPRDLRSRLMGIILQRAQERKLLPGQPYSSDTAGPKVLVYPMPEGSPQLKLRVQRRREVIDVRLRPLGWAIALWLRRARASKPSPSISGFDSGYPTLQIDFYPGQLIEGEVTVCRASGDVKLGILARYLIRMSIVLGEPTPKDFSYSTSDILEEISAETIELIEHKRYEAAFGMLSSLATMHATLIQAGAFSNDSGADDNAALLQDPYGLASRRLHEVWLDTYDELARLSVETLTESSKPFESQCSLTSRLLRSLKQQHIDIVNHLLHIPSYLMFRLGAWWSLKVEEHGITHDHLRGAELPLPMARIYEEAVKSFIGAWERLDLFQSREEPAPGPDAWTAHARRARFAICHVERALNMLLEAVLRGDTTASSWHTDSLLRWWSSRRYQFVEVDTENFQDPYANAARLSHEWSTVRSMLVSIPEGNEHALSADLVASILHRYWSDVRLVGVLVLLSWTPGDAPESALSLKVAINLLTGHATTADDDYDTGALNAKSVILQILRMQLVDDSYTSMLDRIARSAEELRRPSMISGRIYGSSGADGLQSLIPVQALLLSSSTHDRRPLPRIGEFEQIWSTDLRKSERAERFAHQLRSALDQDNYVGKRRIAEILRHALGSQGKLHSAEGRMRRSSMRLANRIVAARNRVIGAAAVSQARLDELSREVGEHVLSDDNEIFPFILKPQLIAEGTATNAHLVAVSGVRKSPFTDPPLEPGVGLDSAFFRDAVASKIGFGVLIDYVHSKNIGALRVDSRSSFLSDVKAAADTLRSQGRTPLLVLPQYDVPEVARPWHYLREADPSGMSFDVRLRKPEDPKGVAAFFHDVPAFLAPISRSCFVVAREDFGILKYTMHPAGSCINVSWTPMAVDTITLEFTWIFSAGHA